MPDGAMVQWVREKYASLSDVLNERSRRLWAATEARSLGRGGIAAVMAGTGLSSATVHRGIRELEVAEARGILPSAERIRREGGGRQRAHECQPGLIEALDLLVEPTARGDPESALRWTCKSTYNLSTALSREGFQVGPKTVGRELKEQGFTLQSNRKTREGSGHPDRDAQFHYINEQVLRFQRRGQPVISVDTKKKELVGQYKNAGREWLPKGRPVEVLVHDFRDPNISKAIPYGVYDVTYNEGWVSVRASAH